MFGLGMPEILLILAIALMVIGPKKLPEVAKTLGRAMGEFKNAARDFKKSLDMEDSVDTFKSPVVSVADELKSAASMDTPEKKADEKSSAAEGTSEGETVETEPGEEDGANASADQNDAPSATGNSGGMDAAADSAENAPGATKQKGEKR